MSQKDSENEVRFVEMLKQDPRVVYFFKFPPAFKVRLPPIIGNYNPHWGIARHDDTGQIVLHLMRETKGNEDVTKLQLPHKQRKIARATRHFAALGNNYHPVVGTTRE